MLKSSVGGVVALAAVGALCGLHLGLLGPWSYDFDAFAHLRPQFSLVLLASSIVFAALRWRNLAGVSLIASAAGLLALGPVWRSPVSLPDGCEHTTLTVATVNVQYDNPTPDLLIDALVNSGVDIIATQELNPDFWLSAKPLMAAYPEMIVDGPPGYYPLGAGLFSKKPVRVVEAVWGKEPELHRAMVAVAVAGREIGLASFHFERPWIEPQKEQVEGLRSTVAGMPTERIFLGDFNATPWSHAIAEIERQGGVRIVGGLRRTWRRAYPNPFFGPDLPAVIGNQIDHVFLSPGLGVERIETFDLPGSVHWGVKAVIQIPASGSGCG